jgi:hypothetical protein
MLIGPSTRLFHASLSSSFHLSLLPSFFHWSFTARHSISRNGRPDNNPETKACKMGSGADFHNSRRSMGDLSPRHYRQEIGKLSNYRCEEAHYSALKWVCLGASFFFL